jgi:Ca2+-binding EF-hand superfamily protein
MKLLDFLTTGLCVTTALAGTTEAQEQKKRERPQLNAAFFDRMDTNQDGIVTLEEIPSDRQAIVKRLFDRLDGNDDGKLTRKEFDAGIDRARAKAASPEPPRPPAPPGGSVADTQRQPDGPGRPSELSTPSQSRFGGRADAGPGGFGGPDLFRALDSDSDGRLSKAELANAVDALMKFDKDGDGWLLPQELAEGTRGSLPAGARPPGVSGPGGARARSLDAVIQRADRDGDGKLSKDEVPEMLRERFDQVDTDRDGLVDKDELSAVGERLRRLRDDRGAPPGFPGRPSASERPGRPGGAINEANRQRVAEFLREHDKDADARVSLKEFGEDRREDFKKLDTSDDGFLTPDELAGGLP